LTAIGEQDSGSADRSRATIKSDAAIVLARAALATDHPTLSEYAFRAFVEAETTLDRTGGAALTFDDFSQLARTWTVSSPLQHDGPDLGTR
jgi:hypothetical protein